MDEASLWKIHPAIFTGTDIIQVILYLMHIPPYTP